MSRSEFPQSVRKAAWERAAGICECGCGRPFTDHPKERPHYDHILADRLGGEPTFANCQVFRIDCHAVKTARDDTPKIKKVRRGEKSRRNLERVKKKIPYRKFDGTAVWK